ncbi:shikimate dehydrogenase [Rarobacter incanus]|uniref:Shikimate dehydrogenase n=1 Tax=Rarobacter incanus TaxID=153494 RepID=A0A542SLT4_9MICO|nr:shikimate dehydrogenase [Rarobacter incanus]TQK75594.1 shikimate dehydrogenase [Rarobacter incanus]
MTLHAGVLGHPITHSLSPVLHRAAYRSLGLDWTYDAIDVPQEQFAGFLGALTDDWVGLSLTMPLKQEVLSHLDERSADVVATCAANTLVFERTASGTRLCGHNTDIDGIVRAIGEAPLCAQRKTAAIVGAGATAASAVAALGRLGFERADVVLRSMARRGPVESAAAAVGMELTYNLTGDFAAVAANADVMVSTLPGGAGDSLVDKVVPAVRPGAVLLDVAYEFRPSVLGSAWRAAGGTYVSGERMLLHQAVAQVELFAGARPDVAVMDAALRRVLDSRD